MEEEAVTNKEDSEIKHRKPIKTKYLSNWQFNSIRKFQEPTAETLLKKLLGVIPMGDARITRITRVVIQEYVPPDIPEKTKTKGQGWRRLAERWSSPFPAIRDGGL